MGVSTVGSNWFSGYFNKCLELTASSCFTFSRYIYFTFADWIIINTKTRFIWKEGSTQNFQYVRRISWDHVKESDNKYFRKLILYLSWYFEGWSEYSYLFSECKYQIACAFWMGKPYKNNAFLFLGNNLAKDIFHWEKVD